MEEMSTYEEPTESPELLAQIAAAVRTIEIVTYLQEQGYEEAAEMVALDHEMECPCGCGYRADEHDHGRWAEAEEFDRVMEDLHQAETDDV